MPVILMATYRSDVCSSTMPGGLRLMDKGFVAQHIFEGKLRTTVQSGQISHLSSKMTRADSRCCENKAYKHGTQAVFHSSQLESERNG